MLRCWLQIVSILCVHNVLCAFSASILQLLLRLKLVLPINFHNKYVRAKCDKNINWNEQIIMQRLIFSFDKIFFAKSENCWKIACQMRLPDLPAAKMERQQMTPNIADWLFVQCMRFDACFFGGDAFSIYDLINISWFSSLQISLCVCVSFCRSQAAD